MNGSRSPSNRLGERSSLDALSRTIEGLEARIEGLVGNQSGRAHPQENQGRDTWASRTSERDPRDTRPDPLAEIRERQRMLEESRNRALASAARPPVPQPQAQPRPDMRRAPEPQAQRARVERPAAPQPAAAAPAPSRAEAQLKEIAQALVSLREELKRDIGDSVSREVSALRNEMLEIKAVATHGGAGNDDLRSELARLGESIDLLGHQTRVRGGGEELRAEFEELRSLMDGLAREDSVRHMENRWTGMERRIAELDPQPMKDEIVSIAYRLDDIKSQLGTMNPSPAIRGLEDRLLAVAEAMEQIGHHIRPNDHLIAEQFAGLDLRLDEISRAIAAGARASANQEPEHFGRLERRLATLAEQIETIGEQSRQRPDPAVDLTKRIETLAARVEELATADSGMEAATRLEERLDQLSRLLERNQKAPPAPELTGFLSDISRKIDALDSGSVNDRLNERLEYLARRIDEMEYPQALAHSGSGGDDATLLRLESRLSDIARRLDETSAGPVHDAGSLQGLEQQIANLAALINSPQAGAPVAALPAEFEHRMASLEEYMATSDEYIIEAARQAAEAVMEAYSRNGAVGSASPVDLSALSALADNLRHLEDLAHSSEERTHRTFEALHDTLVQIATRLDDLDHRVAPHAPMPAVSELDDDYFGSADYAETPAPFPQRERETTRERQQAAAALMEEELDDFNLFTPRDARAPAAGPVIVTVEPDLAEAVEETAREFTAPRPVEAAEPKVTRGFLASLTSKLVRKEKPAAPVRQAAAPVIRERAVVDPAPPMAPGDEMIGHADTELLEPGSGAPDVKKILERVRAGQARPGSIPTEADRADLIAAARRAAQAAAQEAGAEAAAPEAKKEKSALRAKTKVPGAKGDSLFNRHRRPILMAVGAVLLAIMTMPLVNTLLNGSEAPAVETASEAPAVAAPAEAPEDMAAAPAAGEQAAPAEAAAKPDTERLAAPAAADAAPSAAAEPAAPEEPSVPSAAAAPVAATMTGAAALAEPAPSAPQASALPASAPLAAAPQAVAKPEAAPAPKATATAAPAEAAAAPVAAPQGLEPKALADAVTRGEPLALFEVGARYTEGRGVKADLAEAARWYQLAADKGFAPAQYRIANLYEKGNGVAHDLVKARDYYERAAKAGNASAMHNLAVLYATGVDGKPDTAKAVEWFRQAADLGVSDSQFNLAILYARGNGIPQDLEESYKWFAIAAKGGDKDAGQKRDDVANAMRPEQLANARAKTDLWRVKPMDPKANATEVPDEWMGKGVKTASVDMKKAIRNIQAILNNNGYDAGKPDGEMGAKTIAAIKAFQKKVGMEADGRITDRLVKELLARNK